MDNSLLERLKHRKEMDPDRHDGSYELMREIVDSYRKCFFGRSQWSFRDLNAIYAMALGTWKLNIEKKKEYIDKGCLPEEEKSRLYSILDKLWDNACHKNYENREDDVKPTVGMFGTGFYSFERNISEENAQSFIQMLTDISHLQNDEDIYSTSEKILANGSFKGMQAASCSVMLHCLKPMTFPILNGNAGYGTIYDGLGIELNKPGDINTYIDNCRKIKKFRDDNLPFKNYRILDNEMREIGYKEEEESEELDGGDEMIMNAYSKNMILYGPPGTGKTYNTVNYAVAICDGKALEELTDYEKTLIRFNELKKEGRIAFTTFHQSYGYEEFIEGIKPEIDEATQQVTYEIADGVFKEFCNHASMPENEEINYNATVYVVRLNLKGKDDLKEECFRNNIIRFDWSEDYKDGWMKWFSKMKPGDYVVSYLGYDIRKPL